MAQIIALRQEPELPASASADPDPWRASARIKREFYLLAADQQRAPDELFAKAIEAHVALFGQAARAVMLVTEGADLFTRSLDAFVKTWLQAPPQVELGPLGLAPRSHEFKRVADARILAVAEELRLEFAHGMDWDRKPGGSRPDRVVQIHEPAPVVELPSQPTSWREITVTVCNEHTIEIGTPQGRKNFSYEDLQLCDRRDGKPDGRWQMLLRLAGHDGVLERPPLSLAHRDDSGWCNRKKHIQALRAWLKMRFQIKADPLSFSEGAYHAQFGIAIRETYRHELRNPAKRRQ
jgi:hypothetical protein